MDECKKQPPTTQCCVNIDDQFHQMMGSKKFTEVLGDGLSVGFYISFN